MKIISLKAENIKRLKAVEITPDPDGNLVIISGKNNQGKTSVLDSIMFALAGTRTLPSRPIRDGEDKAEIVLDLGNIVVTRTFTSNDKSYLKVESTDGAKFSSPQKLLDNLIGQLSFDPLDFSRMDSKKRRATLLAMADVEINLDANAMARKEMEDRRRDVGRDLKKLEAQLGGMEKPDADTPDSEVSVSDLTTRFREAQGVNTNIRNRKSQLDSSIDRIGVLKDELAELEEYVATTSAELADLKSVDEDAIANELQEVDQTNQVIRTARTYRDLAKSIEHKAGEHTMAQAGIDALDKKRKDALDNASLPVKGLGVTDTEVTFEDIPFDQLSSSRQLRVSLGMAMALNPQLRVIRITDGSLLDSDSLAVINEMIKEKDCQVWMEKVSDGGPLSVLIEDGSLTSVVINNGEVAGE